MFYFWFVLFDYSLQGNVVALSCTILQQHILIRVVNQGAFSHKDRANDTKKERNKALGFSVMQHKTIHDDWLILVC